MTNETLIMAKQTIGELYTKPLPAGTALRLRKTVRQINEAITDFEEAKNEWVKREGIKDGATLAELSPGQKKWYTELLLSEVEKTWSPCLQEADLDGVEFSAADLDLFIAVGILEDVV